MTTSTFSVRTVHAARDELGYVGQLLRGPAGLIVGVGGTGGTSTLLAGRDVDMLAQGTPPGAPGLRDGLLVDDQLAVVGEQGWLAVSAAGALIGWKRIPTPVAACLFGIARAPDGTTWIAADHGHYLIGSERGKVAPFVGHQLPEHPRLFHAVFVDDRVGLLGGDGALHWVEHVGSGPRQRHDRRALQAAPLTWLLEVPDTGTLIVTGDRGGLFRSDDRGRTFHRIESDTRADLEGAAACLGGILVVGDKGTLLFSTDDGQTFAPVRQRETARHLWSILPLHTGAHGTDALVGGDNGVVLHVSRG